MDNKFYKFFTIFFISLFGLILFYNLEKNIIAVGIYYIISCSLLFLLNRKGHLLYDLWEKKILRYLIIIIPIIVRIILLFFDYPELVSDEATFYDAAKALSVGETFAERYIAAFPYLYGYISSLSFIFKLFGSGLKIAILFNIVLDLIGAVVCFKTLKNISSTKMAFIGIVIWLYNPMNIIWCTKILPIIIVNTLLILSIYVFTLLTKNFDGKKCIFYSTLTGVCLGITNCFRPIMIIFIIAIILYYIYIFIQQKNVKYILLSILLILIPYKMIGTVNTKLVENYTGYQIEGSSGGWSLYVGSNYQSNGTWFSDDDFANQLYSDDFSPKKLHDHFSKRAINNYKNNGIKNIDLLFKKSKVLSSYNNEYTYNVFNAINVNSTIKIILKLWIDFNWYFTLMLIFVGSVKMFNSRDKNLLLFKILILGFFGATLFVEVSPRYFTPILVPLTLIISHYIHTILSKVNHNI